MKINVNIEIWDESDLNGLDDEKRELCKSIAKLGYMILYENCTKENIKESDVQYKINVEVE